MKKIWLLCLTLFVISQSVSIAADGSGTMGVTPSSVIVNTQITFVFVFQADEVMNEGAIRINMPAGWPLPTLNLREGSILSNFGVICVSDSTATISNLALQPGQVVSVFYVNINIT